MSQAATLVGAAPDPAVDWHSLNWNKVHRTVRRLQARIVKAVREGKWHKVKALVYLLTHSDGGRPNLLETQTVVPEASPTEKLEVDQEEILPTSGRPRLGIHGTDP